MTFEIVLFIAFLQEYHRLSRVKGFPAKRYRTKLRLKVNSRAKVDYALGESSGFMIIG
jgi:hypothetical protein